MASQKAIIRGRFALRKPSSPPGGLTKFDPYGIRKSLAQTKNKKLMVCYTEKNQRHFCRLRVSLVTCAAKRRKVLSG